ncbi:MAG: hypothetical protein RML72_00845 [Bacteroidia bacterium]|nr:hypothetical protein [Bacteroidia bacterium]MDW8157412.1 hypothetical protein [Bacteroidia bacterium]
MFEHIEPFYGWLHLYNHKMDANSPFHDVEHNLFEYDRKIYTFNAHPLWDSIESESLLIKILFTDYEKGYTIIEFLGEWNDLFDNDFKLLCQNCLELLQREGINKFILILENVFHAYLDIDDYYQDFWESIEEGGWMFLLRARENVLAEFENYNLGQYFYWSKSLDSIHWRKLKPWELYQIIQKSIERWLVQ